MMADEQFYGVTLQGENAKVVWNPKEKEEDTRAHKLVLKQILLGTKAKQDEFNVVEVEATGMDKEVIKIPIAVLKAGEQRSSQSFLEFVDGPTTFRLIEGTGPVYIHGHHIVSDYEDMEELEMEEGEGDEDIESEEVDDSEDGENPKKKLKLSNNSKPVNKNSKNSKKK